MIVSIQLSSWSRMATSILFCRLENGMRPLCSFMAACSTTSTVVSEASLGVGGSFAANTRVRLRCRRWLLIEHGGGASAALQHTKREMARTHRSFDGNIAGMEWDGRHALEPLAHKIFTKDGATYGVFIGLHDITGGRKPAGHFLQSRGLTGKTWSTEHFGTLE